MKSEKKVKSHFLTVGILLVLAILLLTLNAGAVGRKGSSSNVNVNPISAEKKRFRKISVTSIRFKVRKLFRLHRI